MNLDKALSLTMPYIRYLAHNSRLYDREDIIQEGMIGVWLALKSVNPEMPEIAIKHFLKQRVRWRTKNFIMSNLVHARIGRTKLAQLIKQDVDVIAKYRHLPCSTFDNFRAKGLSPYKQACFNEGLREVKKREDVRKYI